MSGEIQPLGLIPIPGFGPIIVLPGIPEAAAKIAGGPGGIAEIPIAGAQATWDTINDAFKGFSIGILGIGGLMGFAAFLFMLGNGLKALGIDLKDDADQEEKD